MDEGDGKRSAAIDREIEARDRRLVIWRGRAALLMIAVLTCVAVVALGRDGRGGSSIEVVETGFTELTDEFADVSFGVVIENTSDEVAYHTTACVAVRVTSEEAPGCHEFTVEVLQPGQRVGLGAATRVFPSDAKVAGIDVEIEGPATWEDPQDWAGTDPQGDYDDPDLPYEIVAHDLSVAYSPEGKPVVTFTAESTFGPVEPVRNGSAYAVFRDADRRIVGGSGAALHVPIASGQQPSRLSVAHDAVLPDVATAEVYVFPSGL